MAATVAIGEEHRRSETFRSADGPCWSPAGCGTLGLTVIWDVPVSTTCARLQEIAQDWSVLDRAPTDGYDGCVVAGEVRGRFVQLLIAGGDGSRSDPSLILHVFSSSRG